MADSNTFSLRIVSLDYYMASPIPEFDICYSSFHGGKVNEVPVIRIYGSTPAGQKTCLHIHRILPYLYVPCSEIPIQSQDEGDAYTHKISVAIEKALQLKSKASLKRQYVHGCSLVSGKKFYGYHSSEELFVKIYLYYPHDVSRTANILLGGGVLGKCLQPHEAHIPFILQFLVDYNLYGMGHVHLSKVQFRHPIPDNFCPRKSVWTAQSRLERIPLNCGDPNSQADISGISSSDPPVWISSTVPADWMYYSPAEFDVLPSNPGINSMKRQSLCHLEGDSTADEILNKQCKIYKSLSQTPSEVKMVQSLVPIWEEEHERTGVQEIKVPSDTSKPLPEDVLKTLSLDPEFFIRFIELRNQAERSLCLTPSEKDESSVQLQISLETERNVVQRDRVSNNDSQESLESLNETGIIGSLQPQDKDGVISSTEEAADVKLAISSTEETADVKLACNNEHGAYQMIERLDEKAADKEALGLLKWLTSSQAVDDINSDDELLCETMLSPFLPANTIEEVLQRANMDYESESQKECQEILDSIQDFVGSKNIKERDDLPADEDSPGSSYQNIIPQVDGARDDIFSTPDGSIETHSDIELNKIDETCENPVSKDTHTENKEVEDAHSSFSHNHKRNKMLWGSLPFCTTQVFNGEIERNSFNTETKGPISPSPLCVSKVGQYENSSMKTLKETTPSVDCSVRDLMRRKRKYRVDSVRCGSQGVEKIPFETKQKEDIKTSPEHLDFQIFPVNVPDKRPHQLLTSSDLMLHEAYDFDSTDVASRLDEKVTVLSRSERSVGGGSPEDGNICSHENNFGGCGPASRTGNFIASSCSDTHMRSLLPDRSSGSAATFTHCKRGKESDVRLRYEIKEKTTSDGSGGLKPLNTVAPSTFQTTVRNEELGRTDPQDTDLISLTFCRRSPATDWIDRTSTRALSVPVISSLPCQDEESHNHVSDMCSSDGRAMDDVLPFFLDDHRKQSDGQDKGTPDLDHTLQQESAVCVPDIFQNDGSYLYLLSPRVSPPTAENVKGWLSTGTSIEDSKSSAQKGTSSTLIGSTRSSPGDYNKIAPESGSICPKQHIQPLGSQENCDSVSAEGNVNRNKDMKIIQRDGDSAHIKAYSDGSQDISQISGPEGKSKSTPLSQTGFRDPASVGGGQQLTLLSIEVQANSRGDLRPDPRFDAISIITLAVQNDSDCDVEVYVLLHGKAEDSERNLDGICGCNLLICCEEKYLFDQFIKFICSLDPDILMGWDVQGSSLGFLAERASYLGICLLNSISRTPPKTKIAAGDAEILGKELDNELPNSVGDSVTLEDAIITDEWGRTHASGVHVGGRIVLNVWRLMRGELNLNMYTAEAVANAVLRRKIPYIPYKVLTRWFSSGPERARYRCIEYVIDRAKLNLEFLNQLDMINRTSELARVFGIDFFSVLSRGSQYRVESMYLRLAHTQNYLAISPGNGQVASQPAMECLPLVMEPESGFYADPVVVLDFQSLYPSMIIAYNLCYSTCLGNVVPKKENVLGVTTFSPDPHLLQELKDKVLVTPNGVMYVPSQVRKGVLPRLLEEILSTRIMVKQAMKKLSPSQLVLHRIFNARQLALKLIANVTYGYTAAGFSGRMPCAELADSIVQCGRRTLEKAISFVNSQEKWNAKVIYGDTDSMFVLLKGRTVEDAFRIGNEIASEISAMNPNPVVLKMEKVYHPCFLLTKKRYVGYSYESPKQAEPVFDAKGIETIRRDTCSAVSKTMEQSLRLFFEHQDISEVKEYLERQWKRILSGRVSLQDFVFAKEVRLGTYSSRDSSSLPPAAIVATKAMRADPRAEPRYGDRIPYVVVHGQPGARLIDMVVDPLELLAIDSPYRLNDIYYITKQIIPALQRLYGLVGADLNKWFLEMPRMIRDAYGKRPVFTSNPQRARIDHYDLSKHCVLCGELVEASAHLCRQCSQNKTAVVTTMVGRTSKLEREMQHLAAICRHCGGGDWLMESGVKCVSLACPVLYERCKVLKELQGLAAVAEDKDLYPKCMVEWF